MPKPLSYAQAVRILGQGPETAWTNRLNELTGGILLGATVTTPGVLGWFDAHAVFAKLSHKLVTAASQRLIGAHRLDRTERIVAAHTVVVVAAFFEILPESGLPFELSRARLTAGEQLNLAAPGAIHADTVVAAALHAGVRVPEPHISWQDYHDDALIGTYRSMAEAVLGFLQGLRIWDELDDRERGATERALGRAPELACERYRRRFEDLRADCPEVGLWLADGRAQATFDSVRTLSELLLRVSGPISTPSGMPGLLSRAYAAVLDRPIVETGDLPAELDVPALRAAYLPPLFRVSAPPTGSSVGDEDFWRGVEIRDDLDRFVTGYLTSPRAQTAPIVVLGQPGAGKSVLTKILAAELIGGGFLPVRVPLRDIDSSVSLQRQIEQAITTTTTEEVTWPRFAEAADGRLPVVMLDGFDELLQATATSQTDYLYRIADFQQRELSLGRAVAFVVTTRTSVADRATNPPGTLLLRLEPFDQERVAAWLSVWETANRRRLAARGLRALPLSVAMRFPELAVQPLLLLLLALYDADENALQHTVRLAQIDIYERMLTSFARRQVRKAGSHLTEQQCAQEVQKELRRLSVVAFAMTNRSAQWVTEADLERDLLAVFGETPGDGPEDGITAAGLLLGRFFFVHSARALRGGKTLQTYEFLHSTFGEYFVARYTWQLLAETVARTSVTTSPVWASDDGLLSRLLSFAPLVIRAPTVRFLAEMARRLPEDDRTRWTGVLVGLYRRSGHVTWVAQAGDYRPVNQAMPARYAAYTANLVLLAVVVTGGIRFSDLSEPARSTPARRWHDQVLLWHSQLSDEGWGRIAEVFELEQCRDPDGARDVRVTLADQPGQVPPLDVHWLFNRREHGGTDFREGLEPETLRRRTFFQGGVNDNMLLHAAQPLLDSVLSAAVQTFCGSLGRHAPSAAQALLRVWLIPVRRPGGAELRRICVDGALICVADLPSWEDATAEAFADLYLRSLVDRTVPMPVILEACRIVANRAGSRPWLPPLVVRACGDAILRHRPVLDVHERYRELAALAMNVLERTDQGAVRKVADRYPQQLRAILGVIGNDRAAASGGDGVSARSRALRADVRTIETAVAELAKETRGLGSGRRGYISPSGALALTRQLLAEAAGVLDYVTGQIGDEREQTP